MGCTYSRVNLRHIMGSAGGIYGAGVPWLGPVYITTNNPSWFALTWQFLENHKNRAPIPKPGHRRWNLSVCKSNWLVWRCCFCARKPTVLEYSVQRSYLAIPKNITLRPLAQEASSRYRDRGRCRYRSCGWIVNLNLNLVLVLN